MLCEPHRLLILRDFAAREADQYRSAPLQVLGSISAGRVICGTDLAKCVSVHEDFLQQNSLPTRLLPPSGGGLIAPNKENADGAVGIFWECQARVGSRPCTEPPKNALCHTCPLVGASNKYRRSISVLSEQDETSYLFYVTLSFLCNIICYLISVFAFFISDPFRGHNII